MMWETALEGLMLVFGGLLGSAHCLGMCGGFVLTLGAGSSGWTRNLGRQIVYAAGRISVYAFAGAAAGFTGWKLGVETRSLVNAQAILCLIAGVLLVLEGCWSLNWLPRFPSPVKTCPMISFGSLLRAPDWGTVFAAGVWNGFLPCGLVYAYLALAAGTNSVGYGMLVMLLFGLGTVPALVVAGMSGSFLTANWRGRIVRMAAVCLLVMGAWTVSRGLAFFAWPGDSDPPACPLCSPSPG